MNKRSILFLDDCPSRQAWARRTWPWATIVSTAQEAIEALDREEFHAVYLDHDLNREVYVDSSRKDCGFEVVRWLIAQPADHKNACAGYVVHSLYGEAALAMTEALLEHGYDAERIPITTLREQTP